jgi:hypothetical protein
MNKYIEAIPFLSVKMATTNARLFGKEKTDEYLFD